MGKRGKFNLRYILEIMEDPMHSLSLIINGTVANASAYSGLAINYVIYIRISKNILSNDNKIYLLKSATHDFSFRLIRHLRKCAK